MVIAVAVLLALAANLLKPAQDNNIRIEKMQQILKSANVKVLPDKAISAYNKYIISELTINKDGEILSEFTGGKQIKGNIRPFDIDLKLELKKIENKDGKKEEPFLPIFIFKNDKNDTLTIFPLYGKGLWGPIWGYISIRSDKNTVAGVTFGHKGETPGLGAEISEDFYQTQFFDKNIFDESKKFVSISVVKGGVKNSPTNPIHGVDAISGGTITSNGLNDMLKDCLKNYETYLKK